METKENNKIKDYANSIGVNSDEIRVTQIEQKPKTNLDLFVRRFNLGNYYNNLKQKEIERQENEVLKKKQKEFNAARTADIANAIADLFVYAKGGKINKRKPRTEKIQSEIQAYKDYYNSKKLKNTEEQEKRSDKINEQKYKNMLAYKMQQQKQEAIDKQNEKNNAFKERQLDLQEKKLENDRKKQTNNGKTDPRKKSYYTYNENGEKVEFNYKNYGENAIIKAYRMLPDEYKVQQYQLDKKHGAIKIEKLSPTYEEMEKAIIFYNDDIENRRLSKGSKTDYDVSFDGLDIVNKKGKVKGRLQ